MLNINKSSFIQTLALDVSSTVTSIEEGSALVYAIENGVSVVKNSTGAANEFFAGVAFSRASRPLTAPLVEEIVIPSSSPFTVTLARAPLADPAAYILAAGANARVVLTKTTTADATHYSIAGQVMTFHSSFAGRTVQVVYNYTVSQAEAAMKYQYDAFVATDLVAVPTIAAVKDGIIVTDQYDITSDWASWTLATPVRLGASGKFTLSGSGTTLDNAAVMAVPSVNDGFLTIHFNAR